jgi:predicted TIM-barrel fold metal-dependent hydrolase
LKSGRIFFGCEGNEPFLPRVIDDLGENLLMFSSDYPHADRTEGTAGYLKTRSDISINVRHKLLADNAQRFYGK